MQHALESTRLPGAALAIVQHGKVVYAKSFGVTEAAGQDQGHSRHAVPDRLDHQIADDANDGELRRQEDHPVARAAGASLAVHAEGHDAAHGLRVYRPAAARPGSFLSHRPIHAGVADRRDEEPDADDRLRRDVPVQQLDGVGRRLRRGPRPVSQEAHRPSLRRRHARRRVGSARHEEHHVRLRAGHEGAARDAARARLSRVLSTPLARIRAQRHLGAARRRGVVERERHGQGVALELAKGKSPAGKQLVSEETCYCAGRRRSRSPTRRNGYSNVLRGVLKRKLLELLFDGKPRADKSFDLALERRHTTSVAHGPRPTASRKCLEPTRIRRSARSPSPARAFTSCWPPREWNQAASPLRQDDGSWVLELTEPPFDGRHFVPNGKTLRIDMPQQEYVFTRP